MDYPYTIYAALGEEDKEGWVWIQHPKFPSFTPIEIYNPETRQSVCCESRHIDSNFLRKYNEHPRIEINNPPKALVISDWYRNALGGFDTTHHSGNDMRLEIKKLHFLGWRQVRCACHHPDAIARIGTRLGVVGVWLGIIGLTPAILEFFDVENLLKLRIVIATAVVGMVAAWLACRGIRRGV
jgi:hypothetical protein